MTVVYITVNPDLIAGKRMQTVRSMVTALDEISDLHIVPIDRIDFRSGQFTAYRRVSGGQFSPRKKKVLPAELWINYSDGYYLDSRELGFRRPKDFLNAQLRFYERLVETGKVASVINSPEAERRTLKSWFAQLDCAKLKVIPTFVPNDIAALRALQKTHGRLVLKPDWGGASTGVRLLKNEKDISSITSLKDQVAQAYRQGPEKRLWFCGTECVGGRIIAGRKTPWSKDAEDLIGQEYFAGRQFERDRLVAQRIWERSLLSIGSVDFIGDEVNEINGCGTTFIYYQGWEKIADARPALQRYLRTLVR